MGTQFSITLAKHLLSKSFKNSNVVFSPISIHAVLGMIATGSKGQTLDQLLSFLKRNTIDDLNALSSQLVSLVFADSSPSGGPRLSYTNCLWVDQTLPLKTSFKQIVDGVYNATSNQVDFRTEADKVVEQVNSWAEKQTNGLIKHILSADAINSTTSLIFANAVYFKGAWIQQFDLSQTKHYDFHLLNGSKVQTPFVTTKEHEKPFISVYHDFKVLRLPYLNSKDERRRFTMYLYLPDAKDGLPSLIKEMGLRSNFLDRHLPNIMLEARRFLIPKFKIEFAFEASEMLKELGIVLPFSSGGEGLSEMVEGGMVYVSSIHHKCFVEMNEQGTEAAAVTECEILRCDYDKVDFVVDHPFVFVIREDTTGVVLFMGQVTDPRES